MNKILLSLAPILMQTIFAPNFTEIFSDRYFSFWCLWNNIFFLKKFPPFTETKKGRQPNLCQLVAYAGHMSTLLETNQMVLAMWIDQLQQGRAASVSRNIVHLFVLKLCLWQAQQYLDPLFSIRSLVDQPQLVVTLKSTGFIPFLVCSLGFVSIPICLGGYVLSVVSVHFCHYNHHCLHGNGVIATGVIAMIWALSSLLGSSLCPVDHLGLCLVIHQQGTIGRLCGAVQKSAVQCIAVKWRAVQCSAVMCSDVQCSAVQCSAVEDI